MDARLFPTGFFFVYALLRGSGIWSFYGFAEWSSFWSLWISVVIGRASMDCFSLFDGASAVDLMSGTSMGFMRTGASRGSLWLDGASMALRECWIFFSCWARVFCPCTEDDLDWLDSSAGCSRLVGFLGGGV